MDKIKVGIVNYLNAKPLIYGIRHSALMKQIEIRQDYPAQVAKQLSEGTIDIGLAPVAILHRMPHFEVVSDYCIGCDGAVASVCLFSQVPLTEVKRVLLDYQSRTSVMLARILLREYWQVSPELIDTKADFRGEISGATAGVVIGDRALEQRSKSPFIYDLGEAWKAHTGLPFMFAAWITNKRLPPDFLAAFNDANRTGLRHIDEVVAENSFPAFDLKQYYAHYVDYDVDAGKRQALRLFLDKMADKITAS